MARHRPMVPSSARAIIELLEQYGTAAPEQIGAYVKRMKDAVRG